MNIAVFLNDHYRGFIDANSSTSLRKWYNKFTPSAANLFFNAARYYLKTILY